MNATVDEEIFRLVKKADAVTLKAALATLKAMMAGMDIFEALEVGNTVLIAAGRAPLSADDVLARMEGVRHGQTD